MTSVFSVEDFDRQSIESNKWYAAKKNFVMPDGTLVSYSMHNRDTVGRPFFVIRATTVSRSSETVYRTKEERDREFYSITEADAYRRQQEFANMPF